MRRSATSPCCSSTSTTSRPSTTASATGSATRCSPPCPCACATWWGRRPCSPASAVTSSSSCCATRTVTRSPSPKRCARAVRRAVVVEGTELFVSTSIGVSVNDREGVTAADLLRDADAAMYRAKARGRDCVEAFAPGTHETTVLALRTATELRRGLERGEIVPYFQPIVELTTGHVTGFEALARWLHPERGLLSPDQFLPMAEETGLIDEIGATVLSDALAQFARWRARDLPFADATLSVNVGTRQVVDPAFADLVAEVLGQAGHPRRLAVAGDHRDGAARRRQGVDGRPAQPAQPRPAPRRRRLRHRVLVADLPQALPGRGDQDRQGLRRRARPGHRGHDDRRSGRQPRPLVRHRRHRRGPGDAAAARPAPRDGLRPRPGLPLRPPPPGEHRRGRTRRLSPAIWARFVSRIWARFVSESETIRAQIGETPCLMRTSRAGAGSSRPPQGTTC